MRSPNHYHYTGGLSIFIAYFGLATPRLFYCSFARFSSPGITRGLFPHLKAPNKKSCVQVNTAFKLTY